VIWLQVESSLNISQLSDSTDQPLSESEGYVLEVLAEQQRVVVSGVTNVGVFYGLQSLLSLIRNNRTLPAVRQPWSCFARESWLPAICRQKFCESYALCVSFSVCMVVMFS